MNTDDINTLATYNSEVARGIVHTDEWKLKMAKLQEQFKRRGLSTWYEHRWS